MTFETTERRQRVVVHGDVERATGDTEATEASGTAREERSETLRRKWRRIWKPFLLVGASGLIACGGTGITGLELPEREAAGERDVRGHVHQVVTPAPPVAPGAARPATDPPADEAHGPENDGEVR